MSRGKVSCGRAAILITLFGVPFPHPTPQGSWVQHHRPESCVRRMHKAAFRTPRQHRRSYEERMPRNATRPEGQAAPLNKLRSRAAIVKSQPQIGLTCCYAHKKHACTKVILCSLNQQCHSYLLANIWFSYSQFLSFFIFVMIAYAN